MISACKLSSCRQYPSAGILPWEKGRGEGRYGRVLENASQSSPILPQCAGLDQNFVFNGFLVLALLHSVRAIHFFIFAVLCYFTT